MRSPPLAAGLVLTMLAQVATAAPSSATTPVATIAPVPTSGDPVNGRRLAYACLGCHGIADHKNAYPSYRIPKIGGQSSQYLSQALIEYREGTRRHPTMQAQTRSFSERDIADIAAFLSSLK